MPMPKELTKAIFEGTPIDLFCIGHPHVVGDSVGPIIGTLMQRNEYESDIQIIGTLRDPIVRSNYNEQRLRLRYGSYIVAIDAALGYAVGSFDTDIGPLHPGLGTGSGMPPVGHMYIKCYTANVFNGLFVDDERIVYHIAYKVVRELTDLLQIRKKEMYI